MNWHFCLKWDPCELKARREKGFFRAAHPHTFFLGQWPPGAIQNSIGICRPYFSRKVCPKSGLRFQDHHSSDHESQTHIQSKVIWVSAPIPIAHHFRALWCGSSCWKGPGVQIIDRTTEVQGAAPSCLGNFLYFCLSPPPPIHAST